MRKIITLILFLSLIGYASEFEDFDPNTSTLYVSLGSFCEIAHVLKASGLRKAAFPFDWIVSMDLEKVIEMIEEDFCYFLNPNYLKVYQGGPRPLFNTYYHLEFLHEGEWYPERYAENWKKFISKYQRRIERFKELATFPGKVIFLRSSYIFSLKDPHRFYKFADNLEIRDEAALNLYDALKRRFPSLDFSLVIVNFHNHSQLLEEKQLSEDIIFVRANSSMGLEEKAEAYKSYLLSKFENFFPEIE